MVHPFWMVMRFPDGWKVMTGSPMGQYAEKLIKMFVYHSYDIQIASHVYGLQGVSDPDVLQLFSAVRYG